VVAKIASMSPSLVRDTRGRWWSPPPGLDLGPVKLPVHRQWMPSSLQAWVSAGAEWNRAWNPRLPCQSTGSSAHTCIPHQQKQQQ
jgi:hypothetical protein